LPTGSTGNRERALRLGAARRPALGWCRQPRAAGISATSRV